MRKPKPWHDKEYIEKSCERHLGMDKNKMPKNCFRLYCDIFKIYIQLMYYMFKESHDKAHILLEFFRKELREGNTTRRDSLFEGEKK